MKEQESFALKEHGRMFAKLYKNEGLLSALGYEARALSAVASHFLDILYESSMVMPDDTESRVMARAFNTPNAYEEMCLRDAGSREKIKQHLELMRYSFIDGRMYEIKE